MKSKKTKQFWGFTFLIITAMLMIATSSMAQSKPWAKLDNGVLTFTYGTKPAEAPVKCANCGKMVAVAHKFCPSCGTAKASDQKVFVVPLNAKDYNNIPWWDIKEEVKKVVFAASFKQLTKITSTVFWFDGMKNLKSIVGLENLKTSNVTNMVCMFDRCKSLTSLNLSTFDTRNVTNMGAMFRECESLISLNLSGFKTGKVTNMGFMFMECKRLTSLNLSAFDTKNVTEMNYMFDKCESLTSLNLSAFDTRNVIMMNSMFDGCKSLTSLNLSTFDTRNVTDMERMFRECKSLTSLDISHFDMGSVETVFEMFCDCTSLKTLSLPVGSWDFERIKSRSEFPRVATKDVFYQCPAEKIMK